MIVIATPKELELVDKILGDQAYHYYPILVTGVGGTNVVEKLRDIPRDTPIINIGYAGSSNTKIGTIVEVSQCSIYHPNVEYNESVFRLPKGAFDDKVLDALSQKRMTCYTSNDFVLETKQHDCVFDMELAFICALGFENLRSIKMVSDNLSIDQYETVEEKIITFTNK